MLVFIAINTRLNSIFPDAGQDRYISPHVAAKPFQPAKLNVEIAFQWIVEIDQGLEVGPAQLSPQCGDFFLVRKCFGKTEHVAEILGRKSASVASGQLFRQGEDDLFAIVGALAVEDVTVNALADLPGVIAESSRKSTLSGIKEGWARVPEGPE